MEGKQIPAGIKLFPALLTTLIFISVICGCSFKKPGSEGINKEIKVFGAQIFSDIDYKEIDGVSAAKEPCINGYEYIYDILNISIGYSFSGYIRKITSLNMNTTMFNIRVGDSFQDSSEKLIKNGFHKGDTQFIFVKDWCLFTLLVNEKQKVFGMRVEVID